MQVIRTLATNMLPEANLLIEINALTFANKTSINKLLFNGKWEYVKVMRIIMYNNSYC